MFKTNYRIIRDLYNGYEVQFKLWWLPVWLQAGFTNTHPSLEQAQRWLMNYRQDVVDECK